MKTSGFVLLIVVLVSTLLVSAQVRLEKTNGLSEAPVPAAVRGAVEAQGYRVLRSDGTPLADLWLRKTVPAAASAGKGALYSALSQSVLLGVVSFPAGAKDFRGQAIKPGFYTMRYELLPEDGNHLGVAPNPDFVLLIPASADTDPTAKYDFGKLVELSAKAAATSHPAAFAMLAPESGNLPKATQNADSFVVFSGELKLDNGKTLPFSLVLKGQAEQ